MSRGRGESLVRGELKQLQQQQQQQHQQQRHKLQRRGSSDSSNGSGSHTNTNSTQKQQGLLSFDLIQGNSNIAAITGVHSNQDHIWLVKIGDYIGFYVDRRS